MSMTALEDVGRWGRSVVATAGIGHGQPAPYFRAGSRMGRWSGRHRAAPRRGRGGTAAPAGEAVARWRTGRCLCASGTGRRRCSRRIRPGRRQGKRSRRVGAGEASLRQVRAGDTAAPSRSWGGAAPGGGHGGVAPA
ncbi:hypothetical protein U9M48_012363 [Paspalum notatum var. saurae]|uniref:Uncharacterized protein n=1 Tax=Paspalum notatum var. saurae TaxID=547442 RepID=A0AAQ3SXB6_PASNO